LVPPERLATVGKGVVPRAGVSIQQVAEDAREAGLDDQRSAG
jgi:hypothetical protein